MSKERELLKELITRDMVEYYYPTLVKKVEELLAQPEQTEQKPLSDETIAKLWRESYSGTAQMVRNFARAIEQQHGIGGGK